MVIESMNGIFLETAISVAFHPTDGHPYQEEYTYQYHGGQEDHDNQVDSVVWEAGISSHAAVDGRGHGSLCHSYHRRGHDLVHLAPFGECCRYSDLFAFLALYDVVLLRQPFRPQSIPL